MARRVYATPAQLTQWTGKPPPPDAERLLTRASEDVDDALLTAIYDVDADGMPTDPAVAQALADAACAQVAYREETGDTGTGAAGRWSSVSIGPVSMSGPQQQAGGTGAGNVDLGPQAYRYLARAGLLPGVIR
ncbi:hypothetical protein HHL19_12815 [Streptomyces sp. R302]|uniref:hypothetical protein n=1 Tax=unclassified Streptomyces TaxID=2593676 RepID=UPI00145E6D67|nr:MULTISPECIES: hypothetical protein [unclassified Streptomyces]NML50542.1 hypothetical protein [Streptomyces sp. R301]NML79533.1 hypothetical protein [Streptomyces sp. R302]